MQGAPWGGERSKKITPCKGDSKEEKWGPSRGTLRVGGALGRNLEIGKRPGDRDREDSPRIGFGDLEKGRPPWEPLISHYERDRSP